MRARSLFLAVCLAAIVGFPGVRGKKAADSGADCRAVAAPDHQGRQIRCICQKRTDTGSAGPSLLSLKSIYTFLSSEQSCLRSRPI